MRLAAAFLASGAAGLLFEVLWFRALGRALGNTMWAATLVLAAFMLGIALGALLAARLARRVRRPGRAFAAAELTVALTGTALVWALPALEPALAGALAGFDAHSGALHAARLALAFGLLLVPTIAMGTTLPLGVRLLAQRDTTRALGLLYAANTFGACLAPLAAEYLLIGSLGLRGSALAAAALNVAAAGLAWSYRSGEDALAAGRQARSGVAAPARLLAVAAGAGALALALQVVWFRLLLLHAPATDTSFALMLMLLLAGIAIGSAAAPLLARSRAWVAAGGSLAVVLGYWLAAPAPGGADLLRYAAALMLPAALLSGALFTLLGAELRGGAANPQRAIGQLACANTVGAAAGAALAGFVLLPRLGMEASLFALAAGYVVLALLWRAWLPAALAALSLALFPFGLMQVHLAAAARLYQLDGSRLVRVEEGPTTTLQVLARERFGEPVAWRLVTDSYSMSGTDRDSLRYMQLFAWLPLALHPAPRRALLISYGAGNTAQALLDETALESLTVADTSPEILGASRLLHPGRNPLDDPRVRLVLEDGRHYLMSRSEEFDIITGEPPPPMMAGVVNLYSREYFAALAARLAPGGLATYWLPVQQLEPRGARAVIAAWCDVFPDCSLWAGSTYHWVLLGGRGFDARAETGHFARLWESPASAPRIAASGFEHPAQLGAAFLADAAELRAWTRNTPALTDDRPKRIEAPQRPGQAHDEYTRWLEPGGAARRFAASPWVARHWPQALRAQSLEFFRVQPIVNGELARDPLRHLALVDRLLRATDLQIPIYWLLGSDIPEQRILERNAPAPDQAYARGVRALAERSYGDAARLFGQAGAREFAAYAACRAASAAAKCTP